jgi:uncharacterized phage protein (TIGR01671 family)
MRDIKFRAYDSNNKVMDYDPGVDVDWGRVSLNEILSKEFVGDNDRNAGYTFMQYTGLKDKNDVEIYEGDIVTMTAYAGSTVEFLTGSYWFGGKPLWEYHDLTEVVGNVYENKELLK